MRHVAPLSLGCFLGLLLSLPAQTVDFARVAPQIELKLRSPSAVVRIEAMEELRRYTNVKGVPLALLGTRDPDARVRQAALPTLVQMQTDTAARALMIKGIQREANEDFGALAVALLCGSEDATELLTSLDKQFKTNHTRLASLLAPAEDLGEWSDAAAVRGLGRLTELHAFPTTRGLQRSVVKSLIAIRHRDAVRGLIELLTRIDGELRYQAIDHLRKATGQPLGPQPLAWEEWWLKNEQSYRYPLKPFPVARVEDDGASYYGLPIRGKRVVFIIDNSGSMVGMRLAGAQKELTQAVMKLPPETEFNIVVYNSQVWTWSPKPVSASEDSRRKAAAFVNNLVAGGSTFTYDGLQTALAMKTETVYLLTDGQPTGGQIVQPDAIVAAIRKQNVLQSTTIHTIGLAPGPDTSPFSRFLQALAEQNHGQFRKVE